MVRSAPSPSPPLFSCYLLLRQSGGGAIARLGIPTNISSPTVLNQKDFRRHHFRRRTTPETRLAAGRTTMSNDLRVENSLLRAALWRALKDCLDAPHRNADDGGGLQLTVAEQTYY